MALTRRPADLPAARRIAGPLDSEEAQAAMREADLVVHLAGTLRPRDGNSYEAANVDTTRSVARAVREGAARRVVYLSYVGADEGSPNAYLRTKARAERLLVETRREVVIFRCTHIIGSPDAPGPMAQALTAGPGRTVGVLGDGAQAVAPVYRGDVAAAVISAMHGGSPGIYDLAGPDRMTMDELVSLVNRHAAVRVAHVPSWMARLLGRVRASLPGPMVEVLLADSIGNPSRAVDTFGLTLTPLKSLWAAGAADGAAPTRERGA